MNAIYRRPGGKFLKHNECLVLSIGPADTFFCLVYDWFLDDYIEVLINQERVKFVKEES